MALHVVRATCGANSEFSLITGTHIGELYPFMVRAIQTIQAAGIQRGQTGLGMIYKQVIIFGIMHNYM